MDTFVSTSLTITAPTGQWQEGRLVFIGLNYWTFTPAVAYTHLWHEQGVDFSANLVSISTPETPTPATSAGLWPISICR